MRIVIVWPGYTGYMISCWRALAERTDLRVYVEPSAHEQNFTAAGLEGVWHRRVEGDGGDAIGEIREWRPDLTIVCGWRTPFCRAVGFATVGGTKALAFDMPWEWTPRKILARAVLYPYRRHFDVAFVPGARCARYARWLGFKRIVTGSNPSGFERMSSAPFPEGVAARRGFAYVGRFVREKGLDFLMDAYRVYRASATDPEPLDLIGSGTDLPSDFPDGVRVVGFVPSEKMPEVLSSHRALVLPSRWEPWGVSAAEAMSAGLATVLSDRCGLVADARPTETVRFGDVKGLAAALARIAAMEPHALVAEGRRAREAVAPYADARWCARVLKLPQNGSGVAAASLRVMDFWEHHCVECGEPDCYKSCPKYRPARTGRCERFEGNRFLEWGKLELLWHGGVAGPRLASCVAVANRILEPLALFLGASVYRLYRSVRWRVTRFLARRKIQPTLWRLRVRSERPERLRLVVRDRDLRTVGTWVLETSSEIGTAGARGEAMIRLPILSEGALFAVFPEGAAASGRIGLETNELIADSGSNAESPLKCVAWDLDGVVWDGTLSEGDEVRLRPGVLDAIRSLDAVGIVSSVCSKNDERSALAKMKELGIEDWFVFPQINWGAKSESIRRLAGEMNIGLDAIAFVDDRAENRAEVRANCLGVRVWDEGECLESVRAEVARCRGECGTGGLGSRRRQLYREEMARRTAAGTFGSDRAAFDRSSGLSFEMLPVSGERIDRCRELVQRTNQLNLTARRYDVASFATLLAEATCYAVRVWDNYGDLGIVGFLALRDDRLVECCFSCRSAGRGIERRVLAEIAVGRKLSADIVVTARNAPIREIVKEFLR